MKNSNDTIWNRTRDLPTFSAVPQSTVLLRAPVIRSTSPYVRPNTVVFTRLFLSLFLPLYVPSLSDTYTHTHTHIL